MRKRTANVIAATKRSPVDDVAAAGDAARDLGHKTCRVGRTYSCWHCTCEGLVGPDGSRIGSIFERSCAK